MHKSRSIIIELLFVLIILSAYNVLAAPGSLYVSGPQVTITPSVMLSTESGSTIAFKTQNGRTINKIPPRESDLPYLVLHRNGALTDPNERTLTVTINGIEVPPPGVTVTLELETENGDPDLGGGSENRIPVWRESLWLSNSLSHTQTGITAVFRHEFNETVLFGTEEIATPTDYFRYHISLTEINGPITESLVVFSENYALLMEDQWIAPLPDVRQESVGAAPQQLILYFCNMFPLQKSIDDPGTWLHREDISNYVGDELMPQMIEVFRIQSSVWEFDWYQAWTSYRQGEDAKQLSVALVDGQTWFHGMAPNGGHSGISINVNEGDNDRYDTLTDGIISTFHHELFHNLQRNISQNMGGNGDVDGKEDAWAFFSEGTAVLAFSVGQPGVQSTQTSKARAYMENANVFLAGNRRLPVGLNTSYETMNPNLGVIYWRFLYEQCGGLKDGVEDPAVGMRVISRTLITLYSKDIVDISSSADLVGKISEIMDHSLAQSSCPFRTHAASLVAFAQAIYALRLDGGRCITPGATPRGCHFYDSNHLYEDPPVSVITYNGREHLYSGKLSSSFGMDFVEVVLDPTADEQPLTVEFRAVEKAAAEFEVQVWKLTDSEQRGRPQLVAVLETPLQEIRGTRLYNIPAVDTSEYDRLALIIVRVDANERVDPIGEYMVVLNS